MIKYTLLLIALISPLAGEPIAKRIYFESHSYICFDGISYIHDPDCGCQDHWGAIIRDHESGEELMMNIYRYPASHWD